MKPVISSLVFTVILICSLQTIRAQNPPSFTLEVSQLAQPTLNLLDTIWVKTYHLHLSDTANIAKIHLKMGTTLGGTEVFDYVFNYDQTDSLPIGFHYERNGLDIDLRVSGYAFGFYFYEAQLEGPGQTMSAAEQKDSSTHLL